MQQGGSQQSVPVAWNGVQLSIPAGWDPRVTGLQHLVFEKDFQPQLQLRWQKAGQQALPRARRRLQEVSKQFGTPSREVIREWRHLQDYLPYFTCYRKESGAVGGAVWLCPQCNTVFVMQLLSEDPAVSLEVGDCLPHLCCHHSNNTLWRIQDFSLATPPSFQLTDYSFQPGFSRLSFRQKNLFLHTARLAATDQLPGVQSLEEILHTLTDADDLEIRTEGSTLCHGLRHPSIFRQIVLRLRREKPFIWAKIWHDTVTSRLLAVMLTSHHPIPEDTGEMISAHYEIVQEKVTA